ncbi:MAG TPA: NUDIX-like domain-containing protein, partial [Brevundimonas sp.]|nr:NUDIX-like domain-containing protein [Brevundimonas sp.]
MSLPVLNTFAGNPLDRAGDRRDDADWLVEQATNPEAVALVLWEGRPLIEASLGKEGGEPRLAWLALDHARAVVPDRELFLGLWKGAPCFAVEVEGSADPAAGPLAGLGAF